MSSSLAGRIVDDANQEFGLGPAPNQPGEVGGGKGRDGKQTGIELEFLEYVTCCLCGYPFHSKAGPNRQFWMTSCGHILCGDRDHNHQKGRCTRCRKEDIDTYVIGENLDPALAHWFAPPATVVSATIESLRRNLAELEDGSLSVTKFQTQELMRLVRLMRKNDQRKDESIKIVRTELQKMSVMKKEITEQKVRIETLQRENEDLKSRLDQLQQPQTPQAQQHFLPPRQYAQTLNTLTPVAEEGEEDGYGADSGPQTIRRFETELASGQGSSLHQDHSRAQSRFTTPRAMPSRITMPVTTGRPATTEPYLDGKRSRNTLRVDLQKYRHSESGDPTTPHGFHPYHRPGSAMTRPGSARPYKNQAEYPNFMDGLPVNGQANTFTPAGPSTSYSDVQHPQTAQAHPTDTMYSKQVQPGSNY